MTANHVLNSVQLVAGCDGHRTIPPPLPTPPFGPHVVVYILGLALHATTQKSPSVQCDWGMALGRQHDIGMGPYHFWPNVLLPLVWLGAGNKCEFGSAKVKISGKDQSVVDLAVAVIPGAGLNLQLDCWDFPSPPLPSSIAVASLASVRAGFTLADFLGGLAAMLFDMALVWAVNGIISGATSALGNALTKGIPNALRGLLPSVFNVAHVSPSFARTAAYWLSTDAAKYYASKSNTIPVVLGLVLNDFGIGSPLGYSHADSPIGGRAGSWNDAVHDYFDPPPAPSSP